MRTLLYVIWAVTSCALALAAAEPGESVVVVYNSQMSDSRDVAAHYAVVRHVPAKQILGLSLPTGENMTRAEYRDELQFPLLKFLEKQKLFTFTSGGVAPDTNTAPMKLAGSKIRYVVLCFGVPLRILEDPAWVDSEDSVSRPALDGRNGAAVDSELALLPLSRQKLRLTGALRNPCFAITNAASLNPTNGVLIVARLDGPDATVARQLVDTAVQAETNGLWGRAYFDLRGLTNTADHYKKGDDWIEAAAETSQRFGFETVVDEKPETFSAAFPMSQIALYAGWYDEHASGPFALPSVEFMPGAFAYHLHSFSAHTLRSTTEYWCGPLLAKGVTATMGCIDEPYLEATPHMGVFFDRWLRLGFTFGEAAYAAQPALSWQTTVVGDPLYRPFGRDPRALHRDLIQRNSPWVEWSILRWVDLNLANHAPTTNFIHLLENEPVTRQSAVLSEKLADLYQIEGKPEEAIKKFRQALALHPTPQTVIRLTLALGDQLEASGENAEALQLYEDFQRNTPTYPDDLGLYQKMEMLTLKLGQTNQASRYAAEIKKRSPAH